MKLALRSTLYVAVLTVLLGGVYPAAVTAVSRIFWKEKADGSFVSSGGRVVGSELIGQNFRGPQYLHPRPSAAGKDGYDATASQGTNKGPTDADLAKAIGAAVAVAREDRPGDPGPVPADLVTASASGFDPHLSPDAAQWQAARIARARGVAEEKVAEIIRRHVEPRTLWLLGEPRVNVLLTNLDLDRSLASGR
ncbi:MAG TPA: potassium-transporting ATPase subunit KdpC [Thermoanaerobaculia bacterium]|jgi:K+-transporting ATPase ATPase C chain|nr:potassium-transporting ATPase subunit KdpC [Thermoanaerobaculia bacterium]